MLTLFHSPNSRSTRVVALLHDLGALDAVRIETVTVARRDGSGEPDARNPHPDRKVPFLFHDGVAVWESSAIMLHLADLFPQAGLAVPIGHPQRGAYLSWFAWYAGVMEPVMMIEAAGVAHPALAATFRGGAEMRARLAAALEGRPYLLGEELTAADLLVHSPFAFFGKPGVPVIDAWVDRCQARPGVAYAAKFDAEHGAD